jgi:hypothetical protein
MAVSMQGYSPPWTPPVSKMALPGLAPWIKVKGISTGVPDTGINPLVLELGAGVVGRNAWINSIMGCGFSQGRKVQKDVLSQGPISKKTGFVLLSSKKTASETLNKG